MVRFIVALLALLASTAAMAEPQRQTFKDANGRTLGRSSTDARGNTVADTPQWKAIVDDVPKFTEPGSVTIVVSEVEPKK